MSVNLDNAAMKWVNKAQGFYGALNTSDSWLWRMNAIYGKQGKVSIGSLDVNTAILKPIKCDLTNVSSLDGRAIEFEIKNYEVKIPIKGCDIRGTWLENELKKGTKADEAEYFIDDLIPVVASRARRDVNAIVMEDIITYAKASSNVVKIAPTAITNAATAHTAVTAFIKGLNTTMLLDINSDDIPMTYTIFVSPSTKEYLREYYDANASDGSASYMLGCEVKGLSNLTGNGMVGTSFENLVYAPDLSPESDYFRTIEKREINTSYIIGGVAIGASFIDAKKIVITNNL